MRVPSEQKIQIRFLRALSSIPPPPFFPPSLPSLLYPSCHEKAPRSFQSSHPPPVPSAFPEDGYKWRPIRSSCLSFRISKQGIHGSFGICPILQSVRG